MVRKVTIPYTAACSSVILPTVLFLVIFFGIGLGIPIWLSWQQGWTIPEWLPLVTLLLGVVAGLGVAVALYPLILRLAEGQQGELVLEGDLLRWRIGRKRRELDFSRPHRAQIAAGRSGLGEVNANITLYPDVEIIHLRGVTREEVLAHFPVAYFVGEQALTPAEGLWGFEFRSEDPPAREFFFALLDCLWRNREQNTTFQLYARYPWERQPQPAFRHICLIETETMTPQQKALIEELCASFVDGLKGSYVRLTPDYLVGWVYRTWKSTWSGSPDYYCLMPLGYIRAEVSLPQPDWKPFIVGQMLLEALSTVSGASRSYGPELQDRHYLYVRGRGQDGKRLEMAFDWYGPTDEEWEEGEVFVRFIEWMREQRRASRTQEL